MYVNHSLFMVRAKCKLYILCYAVAKITYNNYILCYIIVVDMIVIFGEAAEIVR